VVSNRNFGQEVTYQYIVLLLCITDHDRVTLAVETGPAGPPTHLLVLGSINQLVRDHWRLEEDHLGWQVDPCGEG